jgi:hypothetical protein
MCGLTCFGRFHAHHQEQYNCNSSLWFYRYRVAVAALLVVIWQVNLPDHDQQLYNYITLVNKHQMIGRNIMEERSFTFCLAMYKTPISSAD